MAMDGNDVWVASGIYVIKYLRGKEAGLIQLFQSSYTNDLTDLANIKSIRNDPVFHHNIWLATSRSQRERNPHAYLEYL